MSCFRTTNRFRRGTTSAETPSCERFVRPARKPSVTKRLGDRAVDRCVLGRHDDVVGHPAGVEPGLLRRNRRPGKPLCVEPLAVVRKDQAEGAVGTCANANGNNSARGAARDLTARTGRRVARRQRDLVQAGHRPCGRRDDEGGRQRRWTRRGAADVGRTQFDFAVPLPARDVRLTVTALDERPRRIDDDQSRLLAPGGR